MARQHRSDGHCHQTVARHYRSPRRRRNVVDRRARSQRRRAVAVRLDLPTPVTVPAVRLRAVILVASGRPDPSGDRRWRWRARRDSNPRPLGPQPNALSTELRAHAMPGGLAEREGFEPSMQVTPHGGLANRCTRPLCDLSVATAAEILTWPSPPPKERPDVEPGGRDPRRDDRRADAGGRPGLLATTTRTGRASTSARLPVSVRHLGDRVRLLEHAGSTSVPGLAAKPIIDMVLAVADSADEAAYVPSMEAAGYVLRIREPDWHQHRLFQRPGRADQPPRLHGRVVGDRPDARLPGPAPEP